MDRTEIDTLKARVDLAALIRSCGLELKKVGKNLRARCPFHDDQEASFTVNPETQLYHCFGCGEGGDALSFLQRHQDLSFPRALEKLQELAGQPAPLGSGKPGRRSEAPESPPAGRDQAPPKDSEPPSPDRLTGGLARGEVLGRVAELYHRRLLECREAQDCLASRGLHSRELWEAFQVGYADGTLLSKLPPQGAIREALTQVGVLNERGKEHLAGCLVVPLSHPDQGVVDLYGRQLDPQGKSRHLFLPGPKRGVLNWQALKLSSRLVLTEGVLDALSLWSAGLHEASCVHGTQSLPRDLVELLRRYRVREVVLCLDADRAGLEAVPRLAAQLTEQGVRVLWCRLPEGADPNQLLVDVGIDRLREALRNPERVPLPEGWTSVAAEAQKERTGDGFLLRFGELSYRVTPRPPFSGRLRVTIRGRLDEKLYLDTVDLYVQRQRAGAAKQMAVRLERPRPEMERHLAAILEAGEEWVAELQQARQDESAARKRREAPPMSVSEREEAMAFLRDPGLVDQTLEDMARLGYVGEEKGKLLAYLVGVSRKLEQPMSAIIRSQSGAGKSAMTELVEALTPPEDVCVISRLSAQAIAYMETDGVERKLVVLEERLGGEAADYSIRVLQSRHEFTQAVPVKDPVSGEIKTRYHTVRGPIAYLETTTNARLNYENATRCFEIFLDESEEQTRRIHQGQREARAPQQRARRLEHEAIRRRHHHAQRLLQPFLVFIPYVERLSFPSRWLRTRRDNERFLCLIEAVAFLHQHQRERETTEEGVAYILATVADYRLAYWMAKEVLDSTFHELSVGARELWQAAHRWVGDRPENKRNAVFSRRDLRQFTGIQDHRLRAALEELVDMEYLGVASGANGKAYHYRLLVDQADEQPSPLLSLTTPEELERLVGSS